ncbi:MAG: toll/interleukin-1 receptor domain-containing protein [Pseudomonadales bacterium]|nr:toll/interleukin-1 receptor domain-containing protein [Pseudomonadales bacterium]
MSDTDAPSIYVSYAHTSESEQLVEKLEQVFEPLEITLIRDKTNGLKYGESIRQYMDQLGAANYIIVVLSDDYLKSESCMYELLEIQENTDMIRRIFPVKLADALIGMLGDRVDYISYWEEKADQLEKKLNSIRSRQVTHIRASLAKYDNIKNSIDGLMNILGDMNTLTRDIHIDNNFAALLDRLYATLGLNVAPTAQFYPQDKTKVKSRSIIATLKKRIQAILKRPEGEALYQDLQALIELSPDFIDVAEGDDHLDYFLGADVLSAIRYLHQSVENRLDLSATAAQKQALWDVATAIFGWLLPLAVDEDKAEQLINRFADKSPNFEFKLTVKTEVGIAIISSRVNTRPVQIDYDTKENELTYSGSMQLGETGFTTGDTLYGAVKLIWASITPDEEIPEGSFDNNCELLNSRLKHRLLMGKSHYIPVPSEDHEHPLNTSSSR